MIAVRQRMTKSFISRLPFGRSLLFLSALTLMASCNPTQMASSGLSSGLVVDNRDGSLDNKAYVYKESPGVLATSAFGLNNPNMGKFIDTTPELITTNTSLTSNCAISFYFWGSTFAREIPECVKSFTTEQATSVTPRKTDRTYIFETNSPEFYATNGLYHVSKGVDTFFKKLSFAYNAIHALPLSIPKSIPSYLPDSQNFWFRPVSSLDGLTYKNAFLTSIAQCDESDNATFSPIGPTMCFGESSVYKNLYMIQDPSIIYHELGHALVSVMLNLRNGTSSGQHPFRSSIETGSYSEASAINEGIADYFSFVMNKRTHVGEWALGRTYNASRPLAESDPSHISSLSETPDGRLSYPQYLFYNSNHPNVIDEDQHLAGQIISHYLVALTKRLKLECSLTGDMDGGHDRATSYILLLLSETLSEIGDLNAKGIDDFFAPFSSDVYFNNLNYSSSYIWQTIVNQTNFRTFSQVLAKNIYKYITGNFCPNFEKNESEKLLDDYGLLLFKTYNNNGNSTTSRSVDYNDVVPFISNQALTQISENNRRKSVLISKQLISLAERTDAYPDRASYYIFDTRSTIQNQLEARLYKGYALPLSTNVASTDYNNGNLKISPGEIVGIIPNLLNNSNSPMAGIQLLANDWDHVDVTSQVTGNFKPCVVDTVTTVDQGGEAGRTCTTTSETYQRLVKDSSTSLFPAEASAPVCLVQMNDGTSSRWVSQNEYRKKNGLSLLDRDCLGYTTSGTSENDFNFSPHECLVRFLPGANVANFSQIAPQKTFYESVVTEKPDKAFSSGSLLLMEVNKWVPPGTKFRCRLRARFSNCSDCYSDSGNSNDDYLDNELNGSKPFKVINIEFEVND
jgi:hypothetical protein